MTTNDDRCRQMPPILLPPLSVATAAELLAVSIRTVQRMIASGQLRALRYGRRVVRIPHEEVQRVLEGRMRIIEKQLGIGGLNTHTRR